MAPDRTTPELLPESAVRVMNEFRRGFSLDLHLWREVRGRRALHLYPSEDGGVAPLSDSILLAIPTRGATELTLEVRGASGDGPEAAANALRLVLENLYDYAEEVRFFAYEMSERYEEINLLYSISETLGSLLHWSDASHTILTEVCEVMGARRGSLWVHDRRGGQLHLVASVGEGGLAGPLETDDSSAVTARVFREGRPLILTGDGFKSVGTEGQPLLAPDDSVLSVPIRYTPPGGTTMTVGVINLIGRRHGGRFTASDQKLLAAIASQVGAALENNRLVRESLERERVTREMELAHDLQMKLLPTADSLDPAIVAAKVEPAESVGGDFYHFFRVPGNRFGVMIGDVSGHGFPAALIMALSMSAGTIYASEVQSPARVLQGMGEALMDELESTEMYLTLFYGVLDPARGELVYANAGHPHAFAVRGDGAVERLEAMDPPMGIAGTVEYGQRAVAWTPGADLLLLFTDGLSDNLSAGSRAAGEERILAEVARLRREPVCDIVKALFNLEGRRGGGTAYGDDRTAVVMRA
ncbi:MAG: GAF domain-containing SpoIIE family protein phosphatase [Gemmatimonadota bacterium]